MANEYPSDATHTPDTDKPAVAPPPLRSVHTTSFPELLRSLGVTVAVSTYQAGKLVFLRAGETALNTHFRTFAKPMGIAAAGGRLALGTATGIWEFHNVPGVCPKLDNPPTAPTAAPPTIKHDACYMPRSLGFTGDIQIHEMAWAGKITDELWFVNTRFSCLCTRDERYSFIPRWRPQFITQLAAEDRCHLNGLSLRDNKPRYVTALGRTDTRGGWRDNKKSGGVVIDITNHEVLCDGLSMPHSPRWHNGRVWLLQSGDGSAGFIDDDGKYQSVATLPGFTRGLDFAGPYAFIGLSQVRETAVFSGIAIADRPASERFCGVWVIDTRTGNIVAFVKFTDAVQEIFGVQVLPNTRWPDLITDDKVLLSESFIVPDETKHGM